MSLAAEEMNCGGVFARSSRFQPRLIRIDCNIERFMNYFMLMPLGDLFIIDFKYIGKLQLSLSISTVK